MNIFRSSIAVALAAPPYPLDALETLSQQISIADAKVR